MSAYYTLDAESWAKKNFEGIVLGDKRRSRRVIHLAKHLASSPGRSIPQLFDNTYAIKATYELFKQEQATPDNLQEKHRQLVYQELNKAGTYLLIEDTSALSWSGNDPVKGLGPIGNSAKGLQGFFLQSIIATRWSNGATNRQTMPIEIMGLADQQYYVRSSKRKKLKRKFAPPHIEDLESRVWEKTINRLPSPPDDEKIRWVRVCDRGADIYEVLMQSIKHRYGFVIRSAYDRCIENEDRSTLFEHIRAVAKIGEFSLDLRSRPNHPERTALLSVASSSVKLKSPQRPGHKRGALQSVQCSVIRVWEANPPEGIAPLEWILLCDQVISTFEGALTCINQYACRWLVEDFHKALKTGLGAEKLQLEKAHRLFAAISIMSVVALRLVELRERFRIIPDASAQNAGLSDLEVKILEFRLKRKIQTVKEVSLAIGRLGGHLNRKRDGMPGLITLWRGMQRLIELTEGVKLAHNFSFGESFG